MKTHKKSSIILLSWLFVLLFLTWNQSVVFAENDEEPIVLGTPTNIVLHEDCLLTWDEVESAAFYSVNVLFEYSGVTKNYTSLTIYSGEYSNNNGVLSANMADKIGTAYFDSGYDGEVVSISVSLKANPGYSDAYISGAFSQFSNVIDYSREKTKINTPDKPILHEESVLEWNQVEHASFFNLRIRFEYDGRTRYYNQITIYSSGYQTQEGVSTADIETKLGTAYFDAGFNGECVMVSIAIKANPGYSNTFISSDYSEYSTPISYSRSSVQLGCPTQITIDRNNQLSWKAVANAAYYNVRVTFITSSGKRFYNSLTIYSGEYRIVDGIAYSDFGDKIGTAFFDSGYTDQDVLLAISLRAHPGYSSQYVQSEYSEYSDYVVYNRNATISLSEAFLLLNIPERLTTIDDYAFEGIAAEVVILPSTCSRIGASAFENCSNLQFVFAPVGISIGENAFNGTAAYIVYK